MNSLRLMYNFKYFVVIVVVVVVFVFVLFFCCCVLLCIFAFLATELPAARTMTDSIASWLRTCMNTSELLHRQPRESWHHTPPPPPVPPQQPHTPPPLSPPKGGGGVGWSECQQKTEPSITIQAVLTTSRCLLSCVLTFVCKIHSIYTQLQNLSAGSFRQLAWTT